MSLSLALALAAAPAGLPATSVIAVSTYELTAKDIRERQRRDRLIAGLCRRAARDRARLDRLVAAPGADAQTLAEVAWRLWDGEHGCRADQGLGIAVTRQVIGGAALTFSDVHMVAQLSGFLKSRGTPEDVQERAELQRVLWVRGDYYGGEGPPLWSSEEKRAFVARADVWAFLDRPDGTPGWHQRAIILEALLDPLSPRHDAVRAVAMIERGNDSRDWTRAARLLLDGAALPADPVRAEALLVRAAPYDDDARLLLLPIVAPRLDDPDPVVRQASFTLIEPWSYKIEPGGAATRALLWPRMVRQLSASAPGLQVQAVDHLTRYAVVGGEGDRAPLLKWIDTALRGSDKDQRAASWRSLASLIAKQDPGASAVADAAYARGGGLLDGGTLRPGEFRAFVGDDDYPVRAIRDGSEGVVEAEVIVAPGGRALTVVVTRSATPVLDEIVQRLVLRRFRLNDQPGFAGRYVRAKLPPVQFRLPTCDEGAERTPAIDGAILVDGNYCRQPLQEVVLP